MIINFWGPGSVGKPIGCVGQRQVVSRRYRAALGSLREVSGNVGKPLGCVGKCRAASRRGQAASRRGQAASRRGLAASK
jgi:hypothetical protein